MEALKKGTSIIAVSLAAITSITAASFSSMNFKLDCQKTVQNAAEEIETDIGTFGKNQILASICHWRNKPILNYAEIIIINCFKSKLCYLPPVYS